ncbi:MAG: UDP-glucose/GDP-mannose dehydrogenase family protein [Candidatus Caldarchaeum sp.]|uniref:UDP-glucose 6-dehydrogenase n=4 Tax=Caldiarchaeum subterraneum TaxID=311458 RepID=A0A7C4I4U1_CALS0
MKIAVVGLGYVGLTTAACLASHGFKVTGIDIDSHKVETINEGKTPFKEPGLDKLLKRSRLRCSIDYAEAGDADFVFISVGTPAGPGGEIDLSYVASAAHSLGEVLANSRKPCTVVVRSTVVPGTTRGLVKNELEKSSGKKVGEDLFLCVNPEFLREGNAVHDTFNPDRIVIGDDWGRGGKNLLRLYRRFYRRRKPATILTSTVNAEMIKYASNAFLAARISLINEIANICNHIPGADITVVSKAVGLDKRIGPYFLNAGLGYGGSCFPKDVKALIKYAENLGERPQVLEAVDRVNMGQPLKAVELAEKLLGNLDGKTAAILGLAFKPNTDDIREAVSLKIIKTLQEKGCNIKAYDPAAMENAKKILGDSVIYASSAEDCLRGSDFCIVVTEWGEFRRLGPDVFRKLMRNPVVIDGRRIYDPVKFREKLKFAAVGFGS